MPSVFVVSAVPAVRAGLRALLETAADLEVIGEANRLETAAQLLASEPDVLLVDSEQDFDLDLLVPSDGAAAGPGLVILGPLPAAERLPAELQGHAWAYLPRNVSAP